MKKPVKKTSPKGAERHFDTIIAPVITEKSTIASENNQVVFRVPLEATKPQLASAAEAPHKDKVKTVNTLRRKGKNKQFRGRPFVQSTVKTAIVTLEDGHTIDVTGRI